MLKLYDNFHQSIDFEILSGGMIVGNTAGPISYSAPYIKEIYKRVEEFTGIKFGDDFIKNILDPGKAIFSSEKPAIALCIIKEIKPDITFKFSFELQSLIYYKGFEPDNFATYEYLAKMFSLDEKLFLKGMKSSSFIVAARNEFKRVQSLGVRGFPYVFLEHQGNRYLISNGYTKFENIQKSLSPVLRMTGVYK